MPPRTRVALALAGLVLLLHLGLLGGLGGVGPAPTTWQTAVPAVVQVRQVVVAQAEPRGDTSTAASPAPALLPAPASVTPPAKPPAETARADVQTAAAANAQDQAAETTAQAPPSGGETVPVYATRVPPAATLQYELKRAAATGTAQLDWQPSADRYRLSLQGLPGAAAPPDPQVRARPDPGLAWASQGGFDHTGLAPLRYTESRRGRELRAANFQRDSGRVTFSGPSIEHPLVPGGQDRLSWMLQLAAVMAANPALAAPGTQVSMWVVGTRGDAEVWTFTVQGTGPLDLPAGRVEEAIHLLREPRRPYDTQAQVWLDPERHHLPVQALLRVRATGEGTELRLQALK